MEKTIYVREYELFCSLLRGCREQARVSQEELARRLGVAQTFISKCERGERRLDFVELAQWCEAIGIGLPTFAQHYQEAHSKLIEWRSTQ